MRAATESQEALGRDVTVRFEISNMEVRLHNGVAVVVGTGVQSTTEGVETKKGRPFRYVHVWENRKNQWLLVLDQVTAVQ